MESNLREAEVIVDQPRWLSEFGNLIEDSSLLKDRLSDILGATLEPPHTSKHLRKFTSGETAALIGISDTYLRDLTLQGFAGDVEMTRSGRRLYSLEQINMIRAGLDAKLGEAKYVPHRRKGEKCQIIACVNFKGGSGKTTQSAHLAQYLALSGYRVLALDLDPQGSLSSLLGVEPQTVEPMDSFYGAVTYEQPRLPLSQIAKASYFPGLSLVPACSYLMEIDYEASGPKAKGSNSFFSLMPSILKEASDHYDVIVLDTSPNLGFVTLGSMCSATGLIVTVHPHMLDTMSLLQYLDMLTGTMRTLIYSANVGLSLAFTRYLFTRRERQDIAQNHIVNMLRALWGDRVLQNEVLKSNAIAESQLIRNTIYDAAKDLVRKSTMDRALESMNGVNSEILGLIHQTWGRTVAPASLQGRAF